jgi:hypothetical protein
MVSESSDDDLSTEDPSKGGVVETGAEIFSILSNEDRLEILLTLSRTRTPTDDQKYTFNEFLDESPIRDSGRFNYHLNLLRETFIENPDDDYSLSYTGAIIALLLHSGKLTRDPTVDLTETNVDCPYCDGALSVGYRDKLVIVTCEDCNTQVSKMRVPPGCVDRSSAEYLLRSSVQFGLREVITLRDGICPNCGGVATPSVVSEEERKSGGDIPAVFYQCEDCIYFFRTGISAVMMTHPEFISFCHDHGLDILAPDSPQQYLEIHDKRTVSVRSRDPWQFKFQVELEGETLTMVLDEELERIESERTS